MAVNYSGIGNAMAQPCMRLGQLHRPSFASGETWVGRAQTALTLYMEASTNILGLARCSPLTRVSGT